MRRFVEGLADAERSWLREAVDAPDYLFARDRLPPDKLVKLNPAVDDTPAPQTGIYTPLERDPELEIGMHVARQTPLHR
ncbi:hypothetical protein [Pyrobaculum ferrireducens]|uniref:hypothetical protein n=1 Tax=Pyrobaculum ferrireducens TaxID=1104324 RepID=UPI0011E56090|nr:hypothetical protein [Pyrobaculum ferrireducens]